MAQRGEKAERAISKKVKFSDWMGEDSPSDDSDEPEQVEKDLGHLFAADKFSKREKKGHLLLQLQKTYKGDERF